MQKWLPLSFVVCSYFFYAIPISVFLDYNGGDFVIHFKDVWKKPAWPMYPCFHGYDNMYSSVILHEIETQNFTAAIFALGLYSMFLRIIM